MLFVKQDGLTALMLAVIGGHHELVTIIAAKGAHIDAVSLVCVVDLQGDQF